MHLTHLEVLGFRNVSRADVDLSSGINLLVGENGAGKTAILEAIYLLGRGRSFRTTQPKQLIRHGDDELVVRAEVDTGQMVHRLARGKSRGGETKAKIDGESAHKQSRFAELLPLQTLLPGIADLVLDGPSIRREFVDWGLFHVEHQYLEISRRYRKALGQRSAWLREGHDGAFDKDPWAQDIAKQGAQINHRRKGFVASVDQQTRRIFAALGAELEVQLVYHGVGDTEDAAVAMAQLAESYERDLRHGTTHIGPHRNDVDIAVNGTNAKYTASRGQAKLIASAIVLAYCTELSQQSNVLPVLLLDDFGAELDSGHRERFFLELERIGCQVIATTTDEPKYLVGDALASRARVFHVEQGAISRYS